MRPSLSTLVVLVRYLLVLGVVAFAVLYLASQWDEVSDAISTISWLSVVVSFLALMLGMAAGTMSWISLLNGLGPRVTVPRAAQVMLVGQLGKYVPGSVWSYLLQMELGRQYGISRPRVLISSLYVAGIGVVSSLLLGGLALPTVLRGHRELLWLFPLLPIGLVCLHPRVMTAIADLVLKIFRRPPLDHIVSAGAVVRALSWSIASYIFYGVHLWLLVNSLVDPSIRSLVLLTGAMSLGFSAGLFAFILPSGVGVREAVLIGAMTVLVTVPQATALSVVSRVMFTVADLVAAGGAILLVLIVRRTKSEPAVTEDPVLSESGPSQ
ncbi:lysylphosphatidylglycerol synthase domain-containing protein [Aeromicrobium wangtongii]|uniref:Flippase-like domain-containing protein n=1 Tax=Aeromicrobium wangtongii TaxID=2969247 RepID=A0ABY5MA63_9ACTN|nr:lysylphosphatidylglycerol synthase domain-containing protein [Aeromicrobium wangtongii]MCD9199585.1 flippase-like domain-containing protein [Aeromicrobium wangtongii]UUP13938.1 flippase-like domain-containing protein [Aeromicrobium wangtongii]